MSITSSPLNIKLVLVEPIGPINLGSVARLCANFGIEELRLVTPRCDPCDPLAQRMAVKGIKILNNAIEFSSLIEAVADCHKIIATCGRKEHGEIPLHTSEEALTWFSKPTDSEPIALVFGREDRGLSNNELLLAQKVIRLDTSPIYSSLNLSHAVAIVLHDLHRKSQINCAFNEKQTEPTKLPKTIQLEDYLTDAQNLLLEIGFLLDHTATARMAKVRALLQRANIKEGEVALLRGMLRQIRWAIQTKDF